MSKHELERKEDSVSLAGTTIERGDQLVGPKTDNTTTWRVVDPCDEIDGEAFVWIEATNGGGDRWIGPDELTHLINTGEWEVQN